MNDSEAGGLVLILIGIACYLLPTIIATVRGKANGTNGVFVVNLLLGWTVVGWFVSFIWACSGATNGDKRLEERKHRELLAALNKRPEVNPAEVSPEAFARILASMNKANK
jgi:hypothetical protein